MTRPARVVPRTAPLARDKQQVGPQHDNVTPRSPVSTSSLLAEVLETLIDEFVDRIRAELHHALSVQAQPPAEAPAQPPSLLSIALLARELQCSRATINRLRSEGLPCVMVCDSPRFARDRVLEWLESRSLGVASAVRGRKPRGGQE